MTRDSDTHPKDGDAQQGSAREWRGPAGHRPERFVMTPIEKLDKLLAESTPGPWDFTWSEGEIEILDAGTGPDGRLYPGCEELYIYSSGESLICKEADLALIVELRNNAEALLAALRTQGERMQAALQALGSVDEGNHIEFNLEGALHDLRNQFDPKDGGVCARTIERAIRQVTTARTLLES